jgi:hypothetical protein
MKYLLEAKQMKSTYETEWYINESYQSKLSVTTCWRWGRYHIEVDDISDMPRDIDVNTNGVVVSSYAWELVSTMDAMSVDIDVDRADGISATEEQYLDNLEVMLEDISDYYEMLHEDGWIQEDVVVEVFGPINLELVDE